MLLNVLSKLSSCCAARLALSNHELATSPVPSSLNSLAIRALSFNALGGGTCGVGALLSITDDRSMFPDVSLPVPSSAKLTSAGTESVLNCEAISAADLTSELGRMCSVGSPSLSAL